MENRTNREMTPEEKAEQARLEEERKFNRIVEVDGPEAGFQYLRDQIKEKDEKIQRLLHGGQAKMAPPPETEQPADSEGQDSGPDKK